VVSGLWTAAFAGCTIEGNWTGNSGGAVSIDGLANTTFVSSRILGNHSANNGGAFFVDNSSLSLTSCLISGNVANSEAVLLGNFGNTGQSLLIKNCTIVGNVGTQPVGATAIFGNTPPPFTIVNSILRGNLPSDLQSPTASVSYSNVGFGLFNPGVGVISADPLFIDGPGGDFHLSSISPCKNAGAPGTAGLPATDLDGAPRIVGGIVDMGADEVPALSFPGTPDGLDLYAQINGSGDPLASVRSATVGSLLSVRMKSAAGSLVGGLPLLAARIYFTGNPFAVPGGGIWMDGQSVVFYGSLSAPPFGFPGLPSDGLQFDFTVPAGLTGQTVRMQGLVTSINASNGFYATSNATEITF
jgi:hypothetical protein